MPTVTAIRTPITSTLQKASFPIFGGIHHLVNLASGDVWTTEDEKKRLDTDSVKILPSSMGVRPKTIQQMFLS